MKPHNTNGDRGYFKESLNTLSIATIGTLNNRQRRLLEAEKFHIYKKYLLGSEYKWPYKFIFNETRILFDYVGHYRKNCEDNSFEPCIDSLITYLHKAHYADTTVLETVGGEGFVRNILGGF